MARFNNMAKHLPVWYIQSIDYALCDKAADEFSRLSKKDAAMGIDGDVQNEQQRKTKLAFAPLDHWLSETMEKFAHEANEHCKWGYIVNSKECIQYAEYGEGQHYDWHVDVFPLSGAETDRKISVVCLLNDPSEWEGGDFEIRLYSTYYPKLKKGDMIAFPSILEHRVTPAKNGTRKSATLWLSGPRFR